MKLNFLPKNKTFYFVCFACWTILFFESCTKEPINSLTVAADSKDPVPAYPFDWQSGAATYMPSNPSNVVPCPWVGQVGGVDGNIVQDVNYNEGWRLVYCTFNPNASPYFATMPPGGLYFALYNIFRGLLRYYLYIPPGWISPSTNVVHGLSLYPQGSTASSMLNFEGSNIVDATQNTSAIMKTNNQQVQALGNWLVCQYEIAYDPNIPNTSWPNLAMQWNSQSINISDIKIDGTSVGTINGTINTPSSTGFNPLAFFANPNLISAGLQIFGLSQLSQIQQAATAASNPVLQNFVSNISSGVSGSLGNSVSGLFGSILGGSSSNTQEVNLTTNSTITLTGNMTNNIGLTNPFLVIPGQSNQTTANGLIPAYTSPMGVFNLTQRPTIHVNSTSLPGYPTHPSHPWDYPTNGFYYSTSMSIDQSVLNTAFVLNPALNGLANISILRQDILLDIVGNDYYYQTNPIIEKIGDNSYVKVSGPFDGIKWDASVNNTGFVRLIVHITSPTNAFPPINLVKTFLANIVSP